MKYDMLDPFKNYLKNTCKSPHTASRYYGAVKKIIQNKDINKVEELEATFWEEELKRLRGKDRFSAAKNGLKRMKEYYPNLNIPNDEFFKNESMTRKNHSVRPKKEINLDQVNRKVNQISNKKLKYAYRLSMISGLRVSELAALKSENLSIQDGKIQVEVLNGKGGGNRIVDCKEDPYLYEKLKSYTEENQERNLFYSSAYMKKKAHELGLECHDLRRIFAITLRNELKEEMPVAQANGIVQKELGHQRFSTTKRYLFNKKLKLKEPKRKGSKKKEIEKGEGENG